MIRIIAITLLCQSLVADGSAPTLRKFAKHFDSYLYQIFDQAIPARYFKGSNSVAIFDRLLAGEAFVVISNFQKIDLRGAGYRTTGIDLDQRVFELNGQLPRQENELKKILKENISSRLKEKFPSPTYNLRYGQAEGDVIMIVDDIWYQYPFSFDGYVPATITFAETISKNPAATFRIPTERQLNRSFGKNLELRLGKPQHQHLVASGVLWRELVEKFGESLVRDWLNDVVHPTREQLEWVVNHLYPDKSHTRPSSLVDSYTHRQMLRQWLASAGFGEPMVVAPDPELFANGLAEHREMILDGDFGVNSSRELMTAAMNKKGVSLADLQTPADYVESYSGLIPYAHMNRLPSDLITRHLASELIVNQQTIDRFFRALWRSNEVMAVGRARELNEVITFERLLHEYQLAEYFEHHDLMSEVDPLVREMFDRY